MAEPDLSKLSEEDVNRLFQRYLTTPEEKKRQLPSNDPLIGQFRAMEQRMREAGVEAPSEVGFSREGPPEGFSTALRLGGGLAGAGVAATTGGLGIPLGAGISAMGETLANTLDQQAGRETEAVPFSGLFGEPVSTGNPVLDALTSEGILGGFSLLGEGAGVIKEGVKSGKRFIQEVLSPGTGPITAKLISKTLDPDTMKSIAELERIGGRQLTVTPKQNVVRSTTTRFLASIVGGEVADADLVKKSSKELTDLFYDVYDVGESLDEAQSVVEGFAQGTIKGQEMAATIKAGQALTDSEKMGVVSVLRGRRFIRDLESRLNLTRANFIRQKPVVFPSSDTFKNIEKATSALNGLNITDIPELKKVQEGISKLGKRLNVRSAGSKPVLLDASRNPDIARGVLSLVQDIDRNIGKEFSGLSRDQIQQVDTALRKVRNSLNNDIVNDLTEKQLNTYSAYQSLSDNYNSVPDTLVRNMTNGEFSGIIQESIQSRAAAQAFKEAVGQREAPVALTTHLMDLAKRDDGTIDFVKMKKDYLDNTAYREGIREIMGSDRLQQLRHFVNSAEGLGVDKKSGNFLNRLMTYGAVGSGGALLISPELGLRAAGTVGLVAGAEAFIKRVLFSEKVGRMAIDAMKEAPTSPRARRAFGAMMGALNGAEATAVHFDNDGEVINEAPVRIRVDGRGQLQLDVIQ